MNQNKKIIRYYLTFFSILLTLFTSGIYSFAPPHIADLDSDFKPSKYLDLTGTPIYICDSDPNRNWSSTAVNYSWCVGSGTWNNPYIIENIMIDGQNSVDCIRIVNSSVFFIIRNCRVYNSISTSLTLYNVNNSKIYSNDCLNNGYAGILLENCQNNTIFSNVLQDNNWHGIKIDQSQGNNIFKNKIKNNEYGVWIVFSDNNKVSKNNIQYNGEGIFLVSSNYNIVSENILLSNYMCMSQSYCIGNIIRFNICLGKLEFLGMIVLIMDIVAVIIILYIFAKSYIMKRKFLKELKKKVKDSKLLKV